MVWEPQPGHIPDLSKPDDGTDCYFVQGDDPEIAGRIAHPRTGEEPYP
jgi:hypothetical protein